MHFQPSYSYGGHHYKKKLAETGMPSPIPRAILHSAGGRDNRESSVANGTGSTTSYHSYYVRPRNTDAPSLARYETHAQEQKQRKQQQQHQ